MTEALTLVLLQNMHVQMLVVTVIASTTGMIALDWHITITVLWLLCADKKYVEYFHKKYVEAKYHIFHWQ